MRDRSAALEIRGELHDGYGIVHVNGEFGADRRLGARLKDVIAELDLPEPPRLVLDLGGVVSWDALAIGAILSTAKRVLSAGGAFMIAAVPDDLLAYCQQARLPFGFHETVEAAVDGLRAT
ncbi:STAS domain-containing protein [Herbidospora cretacea]|uniref:STAS domain-containing protein n=1 Tax=Herbidospora cretacea TaxID=28444 RepID=UPI0007736F1B|nr:STAS domain-containing protein [Herbidospora cretacea]